MVINFLAVLYIHALTFVRRRHNFAILKAIGRTDSSIILPMLLTKIGQGIVVSIVAVFIVTLLTGLGQHLLDGQFIALAEQGFQILLGDMNVTSGGFHDELLHMYWPTAQSWARP